VHSYAGPEGSVRGRGRPGPGRRRKRGTRSRTWYGKCTQHKKLDRSTGCTVREKAGERLRAPPRPRVSPGGRFGLCSAGADRGSRLRAAWRRLFGAPTRYDKRERVVRCTDARAFGVGRRFLPAQTSEVGLRAGLARYIVPYCRGGGMCMLCSAVGVRAPGVVYRLMGRG